MSWPTARYKTATVGGSWVPADMNGVQDQYVRTAGVEADDLESDIVTALGLTTTVGGHGGLAARRGKSIIATEESRSNTAYGTLTTPDQVDDIVLPTDGLIVVAYSALVKESVNTASRLAIFLGANQLKQQDNSAPTVVETALNGLADTYDHVSSYPGGLSQNGATGGGAVGSHVSTGQLLNAGENQNSRGGPCFIQAAAGTYDISIQFKASSGSVTAKERKLWVWTIGF